MNRNVKKLTNEYKKRAEKAQFFTSEKLISKIDEVFKIDFNNKKILEPSFGEGSFIKYINKKTNNCKITAFDIDKKLCKILKEKNVNVKCEDFLGNNDNEKYDIVIGNPPFNLKTKYNYYDTTEGFLIKSLNMLQEKGNLYMVLPSTVLRNKQYEDVRKMVIDNYRIIGIINASKYEFCGADIETVVIHIKNEKVKKQEYFYYDNNKYEQVKLKINDRYTLQTNNMELTKSITKKLSSECLGDLFDIQRGTGGTNGEIHGRDIDFYSYSIDGNCKQIFIGIQNIAYRFTSNIIKNNDKNVCDTITMLKPKKEMPLKKLLFISEFLNSSIANYLLSCNSLNDCKLTIHMDKYYISDLQIPEYCESNKFFNSIFENAGTNNIANIRNKYFNTLCGLTEKEEREINKKWSVPRYKSKFNKQIKVK